MARRSTEEDRRRAQRARLLALRQRKHEEVGQEKKLTWWAGEYGIEYQTLKKVASGERPVQPDDALTIAKYHGVTAEFVLYGITTTVGDQYEDPASPSDNEENEETGVPLLGWVSAGSAVTKNPLHETELDKVAAPPGSTDKTRALEIRGDSLGELFDRWVVYFDDEQRPITPDLLNKLCIVALPDGRVLVKKIKRGSNGRFDLISNTEKPIEGVQIRWAARVKHMAPR